MPKHIAIIMDGNGRWAKARNKERTFGHVEGTKNVRNIAIAAKDFGVKVLTLYAFSTENWARPKSEVAFLMKLPKVFIDEYLKELMDNNIKIQTIGHYQKLPKETVKVLDYAIAQTKNNDGMILNFALNYGSKDEIVHSVNTLLKQGKTHVTMQDIEEHLMTADLLDVDLCIRTSGEQRLSNFLLWQLAYAELYFTDVAWPDFDKDQLALAINKYRHRERRFGGLK